MDSFARLVIGNWLEEVSEVLFILAFLFNKFNINFIGKFIYSLFIVLIVDVLDDILGTNYIVSESNKT